VDCLFNFQCRWFGGSPDQQQRSRQHDTAIHSCQWVRLHLDTSFSGVTGDTDWLGFGFANGQSATSTTNDRFVGTAVTGATWMLFRGATPAPLATNSNKIQRGLGNTDPADWLDPALGDLEGGAIDMRIVLDTTGGTGAWTATWYAKLPASSSYTLVGATTTIPHPATNFNSVGIAASSTHPTSGTGGIIERFSLTSLAPTASALAHHWKLDGNASDSVGTANGTAQGGAGYATGRFGQAVSLDGVNDFISTATAGNAIIPATDYTLMAWVNWDGGNSNRGYIAGGQNSGTNGETFTMGKAADGSDRILFLNLLPIGGQGNSIVESPAAAFRPAPGTTLPTPYTAPMVPLFTSTAHPSPPTRLAPPTPLRPPFSISATTRKLHRRIPSMV
jgi:hypothetical protein